MAKITPWQLVEKLESTTSRLEKEALLDEALSAGCEEFFVGARLAYDALISFGVKKVPGHDGQVNKGLDFNEFLALCNDLFTRKLTGHAARDAIQAACEKATPYQWENWYRRILRKDLKCGVTDTTINKVLKENSKKDMMIPVFGCQLAKDGTDDDGNLLPEVSGTRLIDVKMDGVRVLTIVYPDGHVDQYSRNGQELVNFGHIKEQFASIAKDFKEAFVFDGEVMSATFQDLMKKLRRKSNVNAKDAVLNLFDMLPLSEFRTGKYNIPQKSRRTALQMWYDRVGENLPNVNVIGYEEINLSTPAGEKRFAEINSAAIEGGYEGIMVKDPNAPYECKRSKAWLKVKPFIEVTLKVVAIEEGKPDTKYVGKLGALVCEGEDSGKQFKVNVGSGLSDAQRADIWKSPKLAIGQLVEIRADAATISQNGTFWSLRFPRLKCFRGFKKGEKL